MSRYHSYLNSAVSILSNQKGKNQGNLVLSGEQTFAVSEDPLLRSGIVLAGANIKWSGDRLPDQVEDGIVSAYEISQLNLSETMLVVLSAC